MKHLLLLFTCSLIAFAQSTKPADAPVHKDAIKRRDVTNTNANALTQSKWDYFTSVTIPAGQTVNLDSTLDYSSSDTVRVTLRSATTDLANLLGTAYFTVPNATEFVTQEVFVGTDFFYSNSRGVTFQVAGPQFRLALRNTGSTTMTLTSVLIYTHIQ